MASRPRPPDAHSDRMPLAVCEQFVVISRSAHQTESTEEDVTGLSFDSLRDRPSDGPLSPRLFSRYLWRTSLPNVGLNEAVSDAGHLLAKFIG